MNKQTVNNSFVVYLTYYEAVKELEKTDPEKAFELLKAIMDYGFYGEFDDSDMIIKLLMTQIGFNIDKSNDRYAKAVENGKKGGRPSTIDKNKIIYLHNQGKTNKEVAEELNCSVSTVERTISKYKKDTIFLQDNLQNRKNLNYNYNENDNLNDNNNDNANNNENILESREKKDETFKTTTVNNEGSAAITIEEFFRLGETREASLNESQTEATFYDTGEIIKVVGASKETTKPPIIYKWED